MTAYVSEISLLCLNVAIIYSLFRNFVCNIFANIAKFYLIVNLKLSLNRISRNFDLNWMVIEQSTKTESDKNICRQLLKIPFLICIT